MPPSLKGFGRVGNRKGVRHLLGDDFVECVIRPSEKGRPSWTEMEKGDIVEGGVSDRTLVCW